MKFGLIISPVDRELMLRTAVLAEKCGFDTLWIPDHIISWSYNRPNQDCWTMVTILAYNTKRIMIGSGVTDPYRRNPAQLAQTVATLDDIFPGRISLGIGAGEAMNLTPFGIRFQKPMTQTKEAVLCIKSLWTSTPDAPVSIQGEFYSLRNAYLTIKPASKPHPPIYLGVIGKRGRELVGELGDGWYPLLSTPETYEEDVRDIERAARNAGRNPEEIDCCARVHTAVSDDAETARELVRKNCRTALVLNSEMAMRVNPRLRIEVDFDIKNVVATKDLLPRIEKKGAAIPDETVDRFCAAGKPDDCIAALERYAQKGAKHMVLLNARPDLEETITLYGSKIIPYFKERHE